MRILLVNPPNSGREIAQEKYGLEPTQKVFVGEPLSLETIAGGLKDHESRILDFKAEQRSLSAEIRSFAPDIVGFTAQTCEANTVLSLAEEVRQTGGPSVYIAVGGVHASNAPEFFNRPGMDFVVVGLGKRSFSQLISAIKHQKDTDHIPGIAKTNPGGRLEFVPRDYSKNDLMEADPPRYDLVESYRDHYTIASLHLNMGYVVSAFGCPNDCSFCSIANLTGKKYIACDLASVIRDIGLLKKVPVVRFVDANSFADKTGALKLCSAIAAAGITKRFILDACADTVVNNPELFKRWQEIGLSAVIIGFEEIDDRRLLGWKKKNTLKVVSKAIEILHKLGITIVGDFIVSPDYTEEEFNSLERFVAQSRIQIPLFSVLTPLPGTPLYWKMKDEIILHDLDYYTLTNAVTPTRLPEEKFYLLLTELQKKFGDSAGF
jgi:radical SAM superfamily enzyme YgiQ (UPF0313 family)